MLVEFRADLHIHTCLSPCAELSMTPRRIVEKAASLGINVIAVCDHNSAENVEVTQDIAKKRGIRVIAGIEINSSEEVHILGLFGNIADALNMQEIIYGNLDSGENIEERFGMQVVVNEMDEVLSVNKRLLLGATALSVNRIVKLVHAFGGLAIPSHIDREGFGIIGQLGFIPPENDFDALEISRRTTSEEALRKFSHYRQRPWISSSDAHRIDDIGKRTTGFVMRHTTFDELCLALRGVEDRKVIL